MATGGGDAGNRIASSRRRCSIFAVTDNYSDGRASIPELMVVNGIRHSHSVELILIIRNIPGDLDFDDLACGIVRNEFFLVDVFTQRRYAGNPLAVFVNVAGLSDSEMQSLAQEIGFSETTFVLDNVPCDGAYRARIFTPRREVPFAGHPTLGTAFVIRGFVAAEPESHVELQLPIGRIRVDVVDGSETLMWMHQPRPDFGARMEAGALADVLGLDAGAFDPRFPILDVSTGMPTIVTPLRTLQDLRRIRVDQAHYRQLIAATRAKIILAFCPEPYQPEEALAVRVVGDYYGTAEDAATGSANGCLAGYLVEHRYFGTETVEIRVGQGVEISRPSRLYLRARRHADGIAVSIGGGVVVVGRGCLMP